MKIITRTAVATLAVKSVAEDQRQVFGIASTPSTDRMGDIVDPMGAKFALPIPVLWQHDASQPIGEVVAAKPTKEGIPVTIQLAKTDEPGALKDRLDEAWQSLKIGLVKGLSIGFKPLEYSFMDDGGINYTSWEWLELSAVTIPANADAGVLSLKDQAPVVDKKPVLVKDGKPATETWLPLIQKEVKNKEALKASALILRLCDVLFNAIKSHKEASISDRANIQALEKRIKALEER